MLETAAYRDYCSLHRLHPTETTAYRVYNLQRLQPTDITEYIWSVERTLRV